MWRCSLTCGSESDAVFAEEPVEMTKAVPNPQIRDDAPWSDELTDYDHAHCATYARLLDAAADGANDDEIARIVLSIDPAVELDRAKRCLASHMRRARWMCEHGYRHFLR